MGSLRFLVVRGRAAAFCQPMMELDVLLEISILLCKDRPPGRGKHYRGDGAPFWHFGWREHQTQRRSQNAPLEAETSNLTMAARR